jgi:Na+-driven multidrug efflux pump
VLNAILIFGLYGAPALGVAGAAIATVISRFVELLVLILWGHFHHNVYPFLAGAYRSLRVPTALFLQIIRKGLPLMFNEFFWSLAITMRSQCYSLRGLDVVAAQNINSTIVNLFNVVYLSLGSSIAIVVGNQLGAGEIEPAKDSARKMMFFSITCASFMGLLMILLAKPFGLLYNTEESVRSLAAFMIVVSAITMPFSAYAHAAYFTLRTGGKVMITLLFDCVYMWAVVMPISILLSYGTALNIFYLFIICQGVEAAKCILGFIVLKKGNWAKQLVSDENLKA